MVAKKKKSVKQSIKPPRSIKSLTIQLIADDIEDAEIVSTVKKAFPESKFDFSHVSWYRSTLYRDGVIGARHAPRRTKVYKEWKSSTPTK